MVAGSILGTGGYLLLKDTSGQTCGFDFPCNNCNRLSSCNEKKAHDYRNKKVKRGDG